jgi:hypothetical protein
MRMAVKWSPCDFYKVVHLDACFILAMQSDEFIIVVMCPFCSLFEIMYTCKWATEAMTEECYDLSSKTTYIPLFQPLGCVSWDHVVGKNKIYLILGFSIYREHSRCIF